MVGLLAFGYFRAVYRRHRRTGAPVDRRRLMWFCFGWVVLWLASDWPLATLGAGYLASAHMVQYMLYTLVATPLLLLGTPEWMARRITEKLRIYRVLRFVSRPLFAAIAVNAVLLATHAPIVVDNVRTTQMGGFVLDMIWLVGGLVLWLPLISPLPELVHPSYPVRMIYIFVAAGVFAMIPGGFLTFSSFPLYRTYELAPRIHDFARVERPADGWGDHEGRQHPDRLDGDRGALLQVGRARPRRPGGAASRPRLGRNSTLRSTQAPRIRVAPTEGVGMRRGLCLIAIVVAFVALGSAPAGAVNLTGGCQGQGTSFDKDHNQIMAATAPSAEPGTSGNPFLVDYDGTVEYAGTGTTDAQPPLGDQGLRHPGEVRRRAERLASDRDDRRRGRQRLPPVQDHRRLLRVGRDPR